MLFFKQCPVSYSTPYEKIGDEVRSLADLAPFEIPSSWEWCRVGDLFSNMSGLAYKKDALAIKADKMVRVLRGGNIGEEQFYFKGDDVFISSELVKPELYLRKNYMISPAVSSLDHIGKIALIDKDFTMIEEFERHLRGTNLSENTISSYLFAIRQYSSQYDGITKKNLRAYKVWLIENYKPKTVHLRLRAINCYLESIGKESWKMPFVRVQQKAFLENVISEADYEYFKNCLKRDDELFWYFVIRFLAATGARVSELIQIKAEHIKLGHLDLYSKGGKLRRIYIPKALQNEALSWLNDKHC